MQATIVFEQTRNAIDKLCETCNGDGVLFAAECSWCGGSGRHWRYIIEEGSSRSSKTGSILQELHLYGIENTGKRITIWRDTKADCRKTVLKDFQEYLIMTEKDERGQPVVDAKGRYKLAWQGQEFIKSFNKTESIYEYATGSTLEIHGTDDEVKVMGLNKSVAWLNEPYKISRSTFNQLDQRTTDFVIIDWNPKEAHWIDDIKKDPRAITIYSTFLDNPFCPPEQRKKILSYQTVKRCFLVMSGIMQESEALIYDIESNPNGYTPALIKELARCRQNEAQNSASDFDWMVYGLGLKSERPNRIFSWQSIPDAQYHALNVPVYIGCDWGINHPFAIVECKYYEGALYVHQRNYLSETELQRELLPEDRAQIQNGEEGLVMWLFRRLGIRKTDPIICDNNQPGKVGVLRNAEYHALLADKRSGTIQTGIGMLNDIKVYYTASSTNIESEQENYSYLTDRNNVVTDIPIDDYNHAIDSIRYVYMWLVFRGIARIR